jgi:hypothetical protein
MQNLCGGRMSYVFMSEYTANHVLPSLFVMASEYFYSTYFIAPSTNCKSPTCTVSTTTIHELRKVPLYVLELLCFGDALLWSCTA